MVVSYYLNSMFQLTVTNFFYCVEKISDLFYLVLVKMKYALVLVHIQGALYGVFNYFFKLVFLDTGEKFFSSCKFFKGYSVNIPPNPVPSFFYSIFLGHGCSHRGRAKVKMPARKRTTGPAGGLRCQEELEVCL